MTTSSWRRAPNTRSPLAQPSSSSHLQGRSQSAPLSGTQSAADGASVSGGQPANLQNAHPLSQVSFPLALAPYPMQPMQGVMFQQPQQFTLPQFAFGQQPLQQQLQLASLQLQQLLQQLAQQPEQQFAQQPAQLQQLVPPPPPPPGRPVVRDPRRRRGHAGVIEEVTTPLLHVRTDRAELSTYCLG